MPGRVVKGLGVSPGVAVGRVHLVRPALLPVVPESTPPERVADEIEFFRRACDDAKAEILELKRTVARELGDNYAAILEVQKLILEDAGLIDRTLERIRVGRVSASWALKETVAEVMRRFDALDDPYIRERGGELRDVHLRLQRLLRGDLRGPADSSDGPLIVVAPNLGPSDAITLARQGIVGLATDGGGQTSHTAILAQALSVPAVAALHDISQQVRSGDRIVVDGDSGEVLLQPTPDEEAGAERRRRYWLDHEREMASARERPATTEDGMEVVLRANIEFPMEVDSAVRYGARGIGLYRSEFLFLTRSPSFPTEQEHFETYREIAEKVAPHPAVIRTFDLGGEKYFHEVLDRAESNPVLGLRAVRLCLSRLDIFRPQLRGLLRAATLGNLRVMLPLVVSAEEIREVRRLLAEEAESLKTAGVPARADVPLGIMIEVPAAATAADLLARESDFFSVGTNDLIQYALAVDRGNESVSHLYTPLHPGLLRMMRFVVQSAQGAGIPVSVCGEMGADPALVPTLLALGFRELSVPPRSIAPVRDAVCGVNVGREERRLFEDLGLGARELHPKSG